MKLNLKIAAATAAVAMLGSTAAYAVPGITVAAPGSYTYSAEGLALSGNTAVTLPVITIEFGNVGPPGNLLTDTLNFSTFTLGSPAGTTWTGPTAVTTAQVATITGDFAWVDGTDTNATCDVAEFNTALNLYAAWTVTSASDCTKVVLSGPTTDTTNQGYFQIPGNKVLNATDWTGTVAFSYDLSTNASIKGSSTLNWDPGIWTINGAQVYIQYMPYGEGLSRIVYVANDGVLNSPVTADITANGSQFSCSLGTAPAKTVTSLSGAIDGCVAAKGIVTGKVAILLTFIAPDVDIEVYSAYNAGGADRGTVVNTSNGRSFFYGTGVTFP